MAEVGILKKKKKERYLDVQGILASAVFAQVKIQSFVTYEHTVLGQAWMDAPQNNQEACCVTLLA